MYNAPADLGEELKSIFEVTERLFAFLPFAAYKWRQRLLVFREERL
jgi:hypothetical protein